MYINDDITIKINERFHNFSGLTYVENPMDVRSDAHRQDQERTHPRDNKSGASKKTTVRRLHWYGHVIKRDEEHIPRKACTREK